MRRSPCAHSTSRPAASYAKPFEPGEPIGDLFQLRIAWHQLVEARVETNDRDRHRRWTAFGESDVRPKRQRGSQSYHEQKNRLSSSHGPHLTALRADARNVQTNPVQRALCRQVERLPVLVT